MKKIDNSRHKVRTVLDRVPHDYGVEESKMRHTLKNTLTGMKTFLGQLSMKRKLKEARKKQKQKQLVIYLLCLTVFILICIVAFVVVLAKLS